jgi:hypothetical protein
MPTCNVALTQCKPELMSRVLHTCWQLEQSHGSQAVIMVIIFPGPFGNNVRENLCLVSGQF